MSTIQITAETKKRIGIHNYKELFGTKKENILCTLFVVLAYERISITAYDFLIVYNWLVGNLYQGIIIDFSKHSTIRNTDLYKEARLLKGDKSENLIERETCIKIANFITNNNETFVKELDSCYTNYEIELLLF